MARIGSANVQHEQMKPARRDFWVSCEDIQAAMLRDDDAVD